jgi:hypothetical protein
MDPDQLLEYLLRRIAGPGEGHRDETEEDRADAGGGAPPGEADRGVDLRDGAEEGSGAFGDGQCGFR